MFSTPFATLQP